MQKQEMQPKRRNPVYLNLLQITLPPGGWVSILHRVTGVLLIFATPLFLWFFGVSLHDEDSYQRVAALLDSGFLRFLVWGFSLALWHHFLAGARHLLLDLKISIDKGSARLSAYVVMALDVLGGLLLGVELWP